eukprot:439704-Pelagomonas_calceolata.AAC.3
MSHSDRLASLEGTRGASGKGHILCRWARPGGHEDTRQGRPTCTNLQGTQGFIPIMPRVQHQEQTKDTSRFKNKYAPCESGANKKDIYKTSMYPMIWCDPGSAPAREG